MTKLIQRMYNWTDYRGPKGFAVSMAFLTVLMFSQLAAADIELTNDGKALAVVYISDQDEKGAGIRFHGSSVEEAARELVETIQQISGTELPLKRIPNQDLSEQLTVAKADGRTVILLGSLALDWIGNPSDTMQEALADPSGFVLHATPEVIAIAGSRPRGTEIGVYELLEQLGVRWFFPGEWGTVIPLIQNLRISAQTTIQKPSFPARHFGFNALDREDYTAHWKKHAREGGLHLPPAHGIKLGNDVTPETHPDLFAKSSRPNKDAQVCVSNPEVVSRAIAETKKYFQENPESPWMGMGPRDGSGFCECERCLALDGGNWDPFSNERSVTDRYIWFFNQVLEGIADEFPDKKIAFYVYHCYIEPPVKVKPDPKIVVAIAPIGLCRVHGMNNPICPERGYLKSLIDAWTEILPEVYERGYWFNLADPGMTFVQTHRVRDEIAYYAGKGIHGFRTECTNQWAAHGPSLYIVGKLMWNADVDVDALVRDYCEKLFGPAADAMEQFFTYVDARMRDADHHTGSAFNLLQFYPPDVRKQARSYLNEAKKVVSESPYKERFAIFDEAFSFTENFAEMIEARNQHDWNAAYQSLQKLDEIRENLSGMEPPLLSPRQTESYLRRFFRLPVEQGYARVNNGNKPVAFLRDEWDTQLDPQQVGEKLHYEREDLTGGNWYTSPTYSATWSDLGLRYYKGLAWYRQTVEISEEFADKRVFLWFGGVDESARVWVNGKLVGTSVPSAFTPFEVDVTDAIHSGKNVVAICVANLRTNELGTGGITAPGFFYAPAGGDTAELENVRPLRETFP